MAFGEKPTPVDNNEKVGIKEENHIEEKTSLEIKLSEEDYNNLYKKVQIVNKRFLEEIKGKTNKQIKEYIEQSGEQMEKVFFDMIENTLLPLKYKQKLKSIFINVIEKLENFLIDDNKIDETELKNIIQTMNGEMSILVKKLFK